MDIFRRHHSYVDPDREKEISTRRISVIVGTIVLPLAVKGLSLSERGSTKDALSFLLFTLGATAIAAPLCSELQESRSAKVLIKETEDYLQQDIERDRTFEQDDNN